MDCGWHNVSRREPCPICHKPDWCNLSNDGCVAICRRIQSDRPAKSGIGWIHFLREWSAACAARPPYLSGPVVGSARRADRASEAQKDFAALHASYENGAKMYAWLAEHLGVSAAALEALDVRFCRPRKIFSFPMRNASGKITGLRYRTFDGKKFSEKGSKDGLFFAACDGAPALPVGSARRADRNDDLIVVEGASDTAAALSLGLKNVVGRSSCLTGTQHIRELHPRRVTIFADRDEPGMNGAEKLGRDLHLPFRIVLPPEGFKDLRAWVGSGKITNAQEFNYHANWSTWRGPYYD